MEARSYLILMAVAILVPAALIMAAGLSMLLQWERAIGLVVFLAKRLSLALDQARHAAQVLGAGALPAPRLTRVPMLGHELRNPLAAISGALSVVDMPGVKPELAEHARRISRRQVRRLSRIVDDLLDVRRILSGKVVLQKRRLDASQVLRQCVEAKAVVDAGAHQWKVEVPALWIEGDDTRVGQISDNLLLNAVKYTPAGGSIGVSARLEEEEALIGVRDSGIGIAADTLPLIFDPLVQGPTSLDRAQGGLGLGLALVRELTLLHGGQVSAHSDGPGRGCSFRLRFPLAVEVLEILATKMQSASLAVCL